MRTFTLCMLIGAFGCAALQDDLKRAEVAFDDSRPEDATTWLVSLERDVGQMDTEMRARFYYLRGATAYQRDDKVAARHYLALAREEAGDDGAGLRPPWQAAMNQWLQELEHPVRQTKPAQEQAPVPDAPAAEEEDEKPPPVQL